MTDFRKRHRERNWRIWRMRDLEKRTLRSIAEQFDLSRERIRQIVLEGDAILQGHPGYFGRKS